MDRQLVNIIDEYGHQVGSLNPDVQGRITTRSKNIGFQVNRFGVEDKVSVCFHLNLRYWVYLVIYCYSPPL